MKRQKNHNVTEKTWDHWGSALLYSFCGDRIWIPSRDVGRCVQSNKHNLPPRLCLCRTLSETLCRSILQQFDPAACGLYLVLQCPWSLPATRKKGLFGWTWTRQLPSIGLESESMNQTQKGFAIKHGNWVLVLSGGQWPEQFLPRRCSLWNIIFCELETVCGLETLLLRAKLNLLIWKAASSFSVDSFFYSKNSVQ